jgi:hypothetical protein
MSTSEIVINVPGSVALTPNNRLDMKKNSSLRCSSDFEALAETDATNKNTDEYLGRRMISE